MSLRRRVLLGCVAVAVVLAVADAALASTFRGYLVGRVDEQLLQAADQLTDGGPGPDRGLGPPRGGPPPGGGPGPDRAFSEFYIAVAGADGAVAARLDRPLGGGGHAPDPTADEVLAAAAVDGESPRPFTVDDDDAADWRMVVVGGGAGGGGELLLVGSSLAPVGPTYGRMVAVLAVATLAVLTTLALVAWWVLRQGVRPLAAMTTTAGAIAAGALSERVADTDERTEAGRLGGALNRMLGRIEEAFAQRAETEGRLRRFVADASHELRTPLTSIRGYADLYRHGGLPPGPELDEAMRRVEQEAARMGALVDDLLLLARLDEGRALLLGPVALDALVEDAVRDARAVEPDRPIALSAHPVTVVGDEARLRQAIGNLLANARVHTPAGTPVEVTVGPDGAAAVVEVADHGPGLPVGADRRVFERFYRADEARSRASGGAGLGLAIVAGVVEAHHGEATVASAPGAGARFRLHLPQRPPERAVEAGDVGSAAGDSAGAGAGSAGRAGASRQRATTRSDR